MTKRPSRFRRYVLVGFALLAIGLAVLHFRYPLPYIYRVLVYQDSEFSNIYRFPARSIAASPSPNEWPVAIDARVEIVLNEDPAIKDFVAFLQKTETAAFLVVHGQKLVEERYLPGYDGGSFQNTFSVSKSVLSALVGVAVRDGVLELDAPITRYIPELARRDERFARITVEDLLDMRSGIRYSEDTPFPLVNADDPLIYYHPDLQSIVLERTLIESPPGTFQYNNYNPPLLGRALRRTTGLSAAEYLERQLWDPLGAEGPAGWTVDDHGFERMESGFNARARDLARLGLLYLDRGQAAGR